MAIILRLASYRCVLCILICFSVLYLNGCTTAWAPSGSYYRTTTTKVFIESVPQAKVHINDTYVGDTPIVHTVQYEERIDKQSRKVSYWITQPGWSVLLSMSSLGIYIPFSLIPVDNETVLHRSGSFRNNDFTLHVTSEGYKPWQGKLVCLGEHTLSIETALERKGVDEY